MTEIEMCEREKEIPKLAEKACYDAYNYHLDRGNFVVIMLDGELVKVNPDRSIEPYTKG